VKDVEGRGYKHLRPFLFPLFTQVRGRVQPVEKLVWDALDLRWKGFSGWPTTGERGAAGGRRASTCANFFGPLPENVSSRFMFCSAATSIASAFTRQSVLSLKRLIPCHSLASPNMGSTHTLRLRKAFS
jgi:hypothetical protein